jgi:putative ABC transport system substrate-binding protein
MNVAAPDRPSACFVWHDRCTAQLLGVEPLVFRVHGLEEVEKTLTSLAHPQGSNALIVAPDAFTVVHRTAVIALAAANRLPSIYSFRFFATEGGLISYGRIQLNYQSNSRRSLNSSST